MIRSNFITYQHHKKQLQVGFYPTRIKVALFFSTLHNLFRPKPKSDPWIIHIIPILKFDKIKVFFNFVTEKFILPDSVFRQQNSVVRRNTFDPNCERAQRFFSDHSFKHDVVSDPVYNMRR